MSSRRCDQIRSGLPIVLAFSLFLFLGSAPLKAELTAHAFLNDLQGKVSDELIGDSIDEASREARFRELFQEHFDLPTIGRFVLGRYWRKASPAVRDDFLRTFEDVIVQRFLPILSQDTDVRFELGQVKEDSRDPNMLLVASMVPSEEGTSYKVIWRLKKYEDTFKILDIIAEGVSMAISLRSEYVAYIKSNGGEVERLVASLRDKIEQGAFAPK